MKKLSLKKSLAFGTEVGLASMMLTQVAFASELSDGVSSNPVGSSNKLFGSGGLFNKVTNALIFVIGAVSVLMLIIGGLRYVLSAGNSSSVEGAKNTILFAIIGIVVAAMAFAIVTFVINRIGG